MLIIQNTKTCNFTQDGKKGNQNITLVSQQCIEQIFS